MAGDLLIVDMSETQKKIFEEAGAIAIAKIFHADKSWSDNRQILEDRLRNGPPSNRQNLPAHAYVTFSAANREDVSKYCKTGGKTRLYTALLECSRPLGVVKNNARLAHWPANVAGNGVWRDPATWSEKVEMFQNALEYGDITIEYYKLGGYPILQVFKGSWEEIDE